MVRMCGLADLIFVKLGGSLITDKAVEATPRLDVIRRLAQEVRRAQDQCAQSCLLLGHGSGSFGHTVAQRYGVHKGCTDWRGYAWTSAAATRLNRIVTDAFLDAGVPVVSIQPSASARCREGKVIGLAVHPVEEMLRHGLVPLVYGDVALDDAWGTTIASTEAIFVYLARHLKPQRILLLGEVDGVYSADPRQDPQARLVPLIRGQDWEQVANALSGSHAVDVTGGMRSKVQWMVELVRSMPGLRVHLFSGLVPRLLEQMLCDPHLDVGTVIAA
jgi:isopentenyl phosphate kinase